MDARLSIANMTTEWGALVGWFPVDEITLTYLEARKRELRKDGIATHSAEKNYCDWQRTLPRPTPMRFTPDASCWISPR